MEASKSNALIHQLYVRQDHDECLKLIDRVLEETDHRCEYAVSIKALIERQRGHIQESLRLFQQATALNPHNVANLKQVGRSLALLGRHRQAIDVYEEAQRLAPDDWELWQGKGRCYAKLPGGAERALECFTFANAAHPNEATYEQIAKLHEAQGDPAAAAAAYTEALQLSPESPTLLTALGLLLLRSGDDPQRAFDFLGTSLLHEPRGAAAILAVGAISQDNGDHDAALVRYRVAAALEPNSPQLWNSVGAALFGKQRYIAAIACLKRAMYLAPFDWTAAHNLGLAHLATGQAASAFHHLSAAINLKPDFAPSYALLGIALERLEDPDNAAAAYERALRLDPEDAGTHLNYAIMLQRHGDPSGAAAQLAAYRDLAAAVRRADGSGGSGADPEWEEQAEALERAIAAEAGG